MHRSSVFFPVVYECCVKLLDNVLVFVAKCHISMSMAIGSPYFVVKILGFLCVIVVWGS